jgi:hypothetical protein
MFLILIIGHVVDWSHKFLCWRRSNLFFLYSLLWLGFLQASSFLLPWHGLLLCHCFLGHDVAIKIILCENTHSCFLCDQKEGTLFLNLSIFIVVFVYKIDIILLMESYLRVRQKEAGETVVRSK